MSCHNYIHIHSKACIAPLTVKQHKSSMKMQAYSPDHDIRRKYKDDREAMNQELMKVYRSTIIILPGMPPAYYPDALILTLYWVIIQPLKFMLGNR